MIRRGEPWERPSDATIPPPLVRGSDHDLAAAVAAGGRELRFEPAGPTDLGRALGLESGRGGDGTGGDGWVVDVDMIHVDEGRLAVNSVVLGVPPHRLRRRDALVPVHVEVDGRTLAADRATTVLVVNGGWLAGNDVAPRAHPGDGRLDVQLYAVPRRQRRELRRRLTTASHLPHPDIVVRRARSLAVEFERPRSCTVDGCDEGRRDRIDVEVVPAALRLHLGRRD